MSGVYTDPFSGGVLQPAEVSYSALALPADVVLAWPAQNVDATQAILTRLCDVTPTAAGYAVVLPDARLASVGYDAFFSNVGGDSYTIEDADGTTVGTVLPGQVRYVYLVDNTTEAGVWRTFGMGALTSTIDAGSLVGLGLEANGTVLQVARPTSSFSADYTFSASERAANYVWTGGVGTATLPLLTSVSNKYFFSLINQGTGALTVDCSGTDELDGAVNVVLQPGESCFIHAGAFGSGEWYTLGRGRSTQFAFSLLTKNVTGGTTTLTSSEAANVAQQYTGALIMNADIVVPSVVQVYYVSNQTTGSFNVRFKTNGSSGTTVTVPQNQNAVLLCDGLNVVNAATTVAGTTTLSLGAGSVSAPSLAFPDLSGLYQPASAVVAVAIAGVEEMSVDSGGLVVTSDLIVGGTGEFGDVVTASAVPTANDHLTNKLYVDNAVAGSAATARLPRDELTGAATLALANLGHLAQCSINSFTVAFDNAATLGAGWWCYVTNLGPGEVTLDPNGGELIDGMTSFILYTGATRLVQCDGTDFVTTPITGGVRKFESSGSYVMPPGISALDVQAIGTGASGGAGSRQAVGVASNGGPGGGGGEIVTRRVQGVAAGTAISVTVPSPPAGSAAATVDNTAATAGTDGGTVQFGGYLSAYGGKASSTGGTVLSSANVNTDPGGVPADTGNGAVVWLSGSLFQSRSGAAGCAGDQAGGAGGNGVAGATAARVGRRSQRGGGGGGGGGSITTAEVVEASGAGGASGRSAGALSTVTGFGGAAGAAATNGTAGTARSDSEAGDGGGGGGAGLSSAAGAGGAGAAPGGGGGGGGGSRNGFNSGAGGAGGRGEVLVMEII